MSGRIFVCITCNRYAAPPAGEASPGLRLAQAVRAAAGDMLPVRTVECLNGCPHPCTAALREPGKVVMRFSGLAPEDAPALVEVATRYAESTDGDLPPETLPVSLRGKLTGRVTIRAA